MQCRVLRPLWSWLRLPIRVFDLNATVFETVEFNARFWLVVWMESWEAIVARRAVEQHHVSEYLLGRKHLT